MKKISILGSTGSIGNSVLKIIDKRKIFEIYLLSAIKTTQKYVVKFTNTNQDFS